MSENTTKILDALAKLDPKKDDQWNDSGDPQIPLMVKMTGIPGLTRKDITTAAPKFTRANPELPVVKPTPAPGTKPDAELEAVSDDGLDAREADLKGQLAKVREAIDRMRKEEADLLRQIDAIIEQREANRPKTSTMDEILRYRDSQNKLRAERAAHIQRVRESLNGIPASTLLNGKSPLDAALGHKPNRQTQRPAVQAVQTAAQTGEADKK